MPQLLLFPDPRPLVERLGQDFFKAAPETPGVYLMRDASDVVLYVGKAKNLRKRLASYRVANPERMPRRHLRLLRAVARIEIQQLPCEASALARESELLRSLRPRFNRAGTWPGPTRFLSWKLLATGLELAVTSQLQDGWSVTGPVGAGAFSLRAALVRLLWCAICPDRGLARMPPGWFTGHHPERVAISPSTASAQPEMDGALPPCTELCKQAVTLLDLLAAGQAQPFIEWLLVRTSSQINSFELAVKTADLETITEFARRQPLSATSFLP